MYKHTCEYCGGSYENKDPKSRFCCRDCYGKAVSSGQLKRSPQKPHINHKGTVKASAIVRASDSHKTLVDPKKCSKCRYRAFADIGYHCGYLSITGRSRLAMHPEGLTKDCQEFEPRQRTHRYQAPRK